MADMNEAYDVSSVGRVYRKSLELFAHRYENENGIGIDLDDLGVGQKFFVVFPSGTGFTRTSAVKIA